MVNETVGGLRSNASAALKFRIMACLQGAGVCRIYSNFFPATGSRRILTTKKGKEVERGVIKTRFSPDMVLSLRLLVAVIVAVIDKPQAHRLDYRQSS